MTSSKTMIAKSRVLQGLLLRCLSPTGALAAKPAWELITFGDSLSDSGNFFAETREVVKAPFEPVPGAPYAIGGHHFSNGRTWIEQLAAELHTPTSGRPATRSPGVFTNYAFGRARARANAPGFPLFDLGTQVNLFFADSGGNAPSDATYVVWVGSNDVRDALGALSVDPAGATSAAIIGDALTSLANNVVALYGAGARKFLVLGVPNLAITPAVRALGSQNPVIPIVAEQLSAAYNDGLYTALDGLEGLLPDIEILRLDTFSLLNALVADPESAGLENATDACLTFGVVGGAICKRPNRYLFWDAAHPTTTGHGALADAAAQLLTAP